MMQRATPAAPAATHGFGAAMLRTTATDGRAFPALSKALVRDSRFPVRVTLQHYRGTDGVAADGGVGVTPAMMFELAGAVKALRDAAITSGAPVGSLVVGSPAELAARATAPQLAATLPAPSAGGLFDLSRAFE